MKKDEGVKLEPEILLAWMREAGIHVSRRFGRLVVRRERADVADFRYWRRVLRANRARLFEVLPDEGLAGLGERPDASALKAALESRKRKAKPAAAGRNSDLFEDEAGEPAKKAAPYGLRLLK